jgi:UDP-2-acetamido-3-amino-2,3-dideoxy-glucuronate N-acetyltransferase
MRDDVFIHPTSDVSPQAQIGRGARIWHHCTVHAGAVIGENCLLSQNVYMEGEARLGDNVKVKNNVVLYDKVIVESDVFLGPCVVFTNVVNPRSFWPRKDEFKATLVKRGATIGANAVVVCGNTVGRYAMVGAGSVVTRDVADFVLAYGNPARARGFVCGCGVAFGRETGPEYRCPNCGSAYRLSGASAVALDRFGE